MWIVTNRSRRDLNACKKYLLNSSKHISIKAVANLWTLRYLLLLLFTQTKWGKEGTIISPLTSCIASMMGCTRPLLSSAHYAHGASFTCLEALSIPMLEDWLLLVLPSSSDSHHFGKWCQEFFPHLSMVRHSMVFGGIVCSIVFFSFLKELHHPFIFLMHSQWNCMSVVFVFWLNCAVDNTFGGSIVYGK